MVEIHISSPKSIATSNEKTKLFLCITFRQLTKISLSRKKKIEERLTKLSRCQIELKLHIVKITLLIFIKIILTNIYLVLFSWITLYYKIIRLRLCWENTRGKPGRSQTMRTEPISYKGMTPPSTQNLKALDLRVFFLICCSTFSFLPNVGLRLTLEYLTISPSSVSPSSTTLIHSPSSGKHSQPEYIIHDPLHLYRRSHTYTGHACLKSTSGRLSIHGQTVLAQAANQRL